MNIKVNQVVNYTNGSETIYTGVIVGYNGSNLLVIDPNDTAAMTLHNAGYKVATEIARTQIVVNGTPFTRSNINGNGYTSKHFPF
jgi:hypothetical protein